jgi:hypothetical protein
MRYRQTQIRNRGCVVSAQARLSGKRDWREERPGKLGVVLQELRREVKAKAKCASA